MKFSIISTILSLLSLSTRVAADITLGSFPSTVETGQTYTFSWTATANYTYTLWLVVESIAGNPYAWERVDNLGSRVYYDTLNPSYSWTVPSNLSTTRLYGFYLNGFNIPFNDTGVTETSNWFSVSASQSPSSSTSATPTATSTPSPSSHSSVPTSGASSGASSDTEHKSISGGAIAGIVIGILVLIALIIGFIILRRWRKKKADVESREAAARANRLAPVMQEGSHSFEMHDRMSPGAKETRV